MGYLVDYNMILSDVKELLYTVEELQPNITPQPFKFPSQMQSNDEEGVHGFIKRHKKKLLAGAALGATIYGAKKGVLPQPLQMTIDNATLTGASWLTQAANKARQATGQTTLGDILTKRETVGGYLRNKMRNARNIFQEPET